MADEPTKPEQPPTPPIAASDQPASHAPGEPLKAEVSRTDAPAAGASAAVPEAEKPAAAPKPAAPAAAKPAAPAAAKPAVAAAAKPAAAAAKPPAGAAPEHAKAAAPVGPTDPPPPADMPAPAFVAGLEAAIPGSVVALSYYVGDWTIIIAADQLIAIARHLRYASDAAFDLCTDLTATDWPLRPERFDVIYCLFSTRLKHRVRLKVRLPENQPIASSTAVWPSSNWLEREVFDMFGIQFTGHPDPRRILMPEDWQGYPQRKDYPLEGPGELLMENPIDWLKLRQAKEEAEIE
jgi:NADH-quinone oxidoreductase subunit C